MTGFNCQETVLYRGNPVIIVGKRYGHITDPSIGRMYDIKIGNRTIRDVAEKELCATKREEPSGYVSTNYGAAMPYYSK